MSSLSERSRASSAWSTCAVLRAPISVVVTAELLIAHASANWIIDRPV